MEAEYHVIDPSGDLVLILAGPPHPFAIWNQEHEDALISGVLPQTGMSQEIEPVDNDSWGFAASYRSSKRKKKKRKAIPQPTLPAPESSLLWDVSDRPIEPEDSSFEGQSSTRTEDRVEMHHQTSLPHHVLQDRVNSSEAVDGDIHFDQASSSPEINHHPHENHSALESEQVVRFQVSSKHLSLASLLFKNALKPCWREGNKSPLNEYRIPEMGWDPECLLILMNIFHGCTRKVPRSIDLERLAMFAVLVDYYDCHEIVELWVEIWINQLKLNFPKTYSRDLILWLLISCVFKLPEQFSETTCIALKYSRGPIMTLGLPISEASIREIEIRRENSIIQIVELLHDLLKSYRDEATKCSFACDSMNLGALTKHMDKLGLYAPRPAPPFLGQSVYELIEKARAFSSPPEWKSYSPTAYPAYSSHSFCNIAQRLSPLLRAVEEGVMGLNSDGVSDSKS